MYTYVHTERKYAVDFATILSWEWCRCYSHKETMAPDAESCKCWRGENMRGRGKQWGTLTSEPTALVPILKSIWFEEYNWWHMERSFCVSVSKRLLSDFSLRHPSTTEIVKLPLLWFRAWPPKSKCLGWVHHQLSEINSTSQIALMTYTGWGATRISPLTVSLSPSQREKELNYSVYHHIENNNFHRA